MQDGLSVEADLIYPGILSCGTSIFSNSIYI